MYFMNMEFAGGSGGKEVITQNLKLPKVKDVFNFYSNSSGKTMDSNQQFLNDKMTCSEILVEFFQFYAYTFESEKYVIDISGDEPFRLREDYIAEVK